MTLNLTRRAAKGAPLTVAEYDTNLDKLETAIEASVAWSDVTGKPTQFVPAAHTHVAADVSNFAAAVAAVPGFGAGGAVGWGDITGKPATFAPSAHAHVIADVTGLQTAVDGKQPLAAVLTATTASYTTALDGKLAGIAAGATVNSADATLLARANHTGTQAVSTVTGLQVALDGKQALATALTNTTAAFTTAQETKLAGIATAATANATDVNLRDRTTHTGVQAQSTVTNLVTDLAAKQATLVSATNIKTVNGASLLGAGDVVISGGGGAATIAPAALFCPAFVTGRRYDNGVLASASDASAFIGADRIITYPVMYARDFAISSIGVRVTAAGAGGLVRLGVYSAGANGFPSTLLMDSGSDISLTTTGEKMVSAVFTFLAGVTYWECVKDSGGAGTLAAHQLGSSYSFGYATPSTASPFTRLVGAQTFATAMPSDITTLLTSANAGSANVPRIIKVAA